MARYAEKEAPLLERIIMQEGLERTKAEDWARDEITRLREENARLREALIDVLASLVASVDLLERGGKKAAPSDKMFAQMLVDYKNSIERGRAVAAAIREGGKDD